MANIPTLPTSDLRALQASTRRTPHATMDLRLREAETPAKDSATGPVALIKARPSAIKTEDTEDGAARSSKTKKKKNKKAEHDANTPLHEHVKKLEEREKRLRSDKKQLEKTELELEERLEKAEQELQAELVRSNRIQNTNNALQKARDELFKEAEDTKAELEEANALIEKLKEDLDTREFESRKFRTALAAAFKLLTELKDQVTLKSLLHRTDHFLRLKLGRLGGNAGVAPASTAPSEQDEAIDDAFATEDSEDDCDLYEPDGAAVAAGIQAVNERQAPSGMDLKYESDSDDDKPLAMLLGSGNSQVEESADGLSDSDSEDRAMMKLRALAADKNMPHSSSSGTTQTPDAAPTSKKHLLLEEDLWDEDEDEAIFLRPAKRVKFESDVNCEADDSAAKMERDSRKWL